MGRNGPGARWRCWRRRPTCRPGPCCGRRRGGRCSSPAGRRCCSARPIRRTTATTWPPRRPASGWCCGRWRPRPAWPLHAVTVDAGEAHLYADTGNDLLEALPLPPGLRARLEAFVAQHHVERMPHKRRRDRADPEALGHRPGGRRRRGGRRMSGREEGFLSRWSRRKRGALPRAGGAAAGRRCPSRAAEAPAEALRRRARAAAAGLRSGQPAAGREPDRRPATSPPSSAPACRRRCARRRCAGPGRWTRRSATSSARRIMPGITTRRMGCRASPCSSAATSPGCWPRRSARWRICRGAGGDAGPRRTAGRRPRGAAPVEPAGRRWRRPERPDRTPRRRSQAAAEDAAAASGPRRRAGMGVPCRCECQRLPHRLRGDVAARGTDPACQDCGGSGTSAG